MQRGANKEKGTARFVSVNPSYTKGGVDYRVCMECELEKLAADFYKGRAKCKQCSLKDQALSRIETREWLYQYKARNPCADCQEYMHPVCMQFDHLPDFEKHAIPSTMAHYSRAKLLAEIAKCELVCANCHMIRSYRRRSHTIKDKWYKILTTQYTNGRRRV